MNERGAFPFNNRACVKKVKERHKSKCLIDSSLLVKGRSFLLAARQLSLTVHGHAHRDALLEAAQLTLVARDLVDDAAAFVLAGVGRMEVLLDGSAEEAL